jgi:Asp-tRNA(Asn)/Glu-tRNA(Gln) amidotransferase A subunit family amidase
MTVASSLAGLPSISFPIKRKTNQKLPIGLQLIGARFGDEALIDVVSILKEIDDKKE